MSCEAGGLLSAGRHIAKAAPGPFRTLVCMQLLQGLRRPAFQLAQVSRRSLLGSALLSASLPSASLALALRPVSVHTSAAGASEASLSSPDQALAEQAGTQADKPAGRALAEANKAPLRLVSGSALIPHPEKLHRGGEDAYFISSDGNYIGVADGVGSWIEVGVDAGLYARALMQHAHDKAQQTEPSRQAPHDVLEHAHRETRLRGSSTACVLAFDGKMLHAANLGDSGFCVVRDGRMLFRSRPQQKKFNFPYQMAWHEGDPPSSAEHHVLGLLKHDIVITGTDGLWDNVWPQQIAQLATAYQQRGSAPYTAAGQIAEYARQISNNKSDVTPFAHGARQIGWSFSGGKADDITVVVSYALSAPASKL